MTTRSGQWRVLKASEFSRRISAAVQDQDKRYAFFVGAGCSASSGIPAAGELVKNDWIPRLKQLCAPDSSGESWLIDEVGPYQHAKPAESYGRVMERLFLHPEERQREIERLCDGRFPAFGYAVLAALMALPGGHFNVALTTNFDDLIADAMYLFTDARPLVIHHESLASFIRPTRSRPLLVKLHGDFRLAPQNTDVETEHLKAEMEKHVPALLHDRGLIFLGYGGNDAGIANLLAKLPVEALPLGVYWVSGSEPRGTLAKWLKARDAVWVKHGEFDEMMLLLRDAFELPHPAAERFQHVFERYRLKYEELSERIVQQSEEERESAPLKEAVRRADEAAPPWWRVILEARRLEEEDPRRAERVFEQGLERLPDSAPLHATYAALLTRWDRRPELADEHFHRALELEHTAATAGSYGMFLWQNRHEYDRADEVFAHALRRHPDDAHLLVSYGGFLVATDRDPERGAALVVRATELAPSEARPWMVHGNFLWELHRDYEAAERSYARALAADADYPLLQANLASFEYARGDHVKARKLERDAIAKSPPHQEPWCRMALAACRFMNGPAAGRAAALREVKRLLSSGLKAPGWTFAENVRSAVEVGHEDASWLTMLGNVLSGIESADALSEWDRWQATN